MNGGKLTNPRQGDRSEYLAQYLLSGIAVAAPVIRQEDIGIDFVCNLIDTQSHGMTVFGPPFVVQVKSLSTPIAAFGGTTQSGTWRDYEIRGLEGPRSPLFLGVADKKQLRLDLYATSALFLEYARNIQEGKGLPYRIDLMPRLNGQHGDVTYGDRSDCAGAAGFGDEQAHKVDLGPPITSLTPAIIDDPVRHRAAVAVLRFAIEMEQLGITLRSIGLGHFYWFNGKFDSNGNPIYAWMAYPAPSRGARLGRSIAAHAVEAACRLRAIGKGQDIANLKQALQLADVWQYVPPEIQATVFT